MAYRETPKVREQKARQRDLLLHQAEQLVREGGFAALTMQALANRCQVGVGTLYRQFADKAELAAAVFARATEREVQAVAASLATPGAVRMRLARVLALFVQRAQAAPRLAWALIAEPVAPQVEAQRLRYRQAYQALYSQLLDEGIAAGELPAQDSAISAAALVGAVAQALLEPLNAAATDSGPADNPVASPCATTITDTLIPFCLRAVGAGEPR